MHRATLHEQRALLLVQLMGVAEHHGAEQAGEPGLLLRESVPEDRLEARGGVGAEAVIARGRRLLREDAAAVQPEVDARGGKVAVEAVGRRRSRHRSEHAARRDDRTANRGALPGSAPEREIDSLGDQFPQVRFCPGDGGEPRDCGSGGGAGKHMIDPQSQPDFPGRKVLPDRQPRPMQRICCGPGQHHCCDQSAGPRARA